MELDIHKEKISGRTRIFVTELAWQVGPPLAYLLAMYLYYPYWDSFWLVYDEGYNLMKALLVERGYALYSQIWSDQAPLLTQLLAGLFHFTGYHIYWSRRIILIFTCVMIWAIVQYLRLTWGNLHALAGAVLLILLPNFLVLSVAVLVGQPSLAFAMLSMLALAGWHLRRKRIFLILSAIALSLSLLTKLFTAFLGPVFLLGLLVAEYFHFHDERDWVKWVQPAALWSASLAVFTLGVGLLMVNPADAMQLIQPHLSAAQATDYPSNVVLTSINDFLRPIWPVPLAALVGAVFAWREKRWLALYPLAWMVTAYLALLNFKPVWWHHQMLVTIPASMLAAGAFGESLRLLLRDIRNPTTFRKSWALLAAGLVSSVLAFAVCAPIAVDYWMNAQPVNSEERNPAEDRFMRRIAVYAPQTKWMVTDMPMFAFRAGLPVPPELAVISWKRFAAGDLTEDEILQTLRQYQPEQVLFGRFELPKVDTYLAENYRETLQRDQVRLYIRNDLSK